MDSEIKVADEVWVACALLQSESTTSKSFSNPEILNRVKKEAIAEKLRTGIQWHINLHCVANKPANPNNHRMLYELPNGTKRLFKSSDDYHFSREDGKTLPNAGEIPEKYRYLLKWYTQTYNNSKCQATPLTPVTPADPPIDPELKVTFTNLVNEHQMMDFAYRCPNNFTSIDIKNGACKTCNSFVAEDDVKKAICKALTNSGWQIEKTAMGTKHGVDIHATHNQDGILLIEAKGEGTLSPMRVNYFVMVLGELLQKMDSPDKKYGIALPANQQFVKLIHKLPLYLKEQLRLHIYLVKRTGEHTYAVGQFAY